MHLGIETQSRRAGEVQIEHQKGDEGDASDFEDAVIVVGGCDHLRSRCSTGVFTCQHL